MNAEKIEQRIKLAALEPYIEQMGQNALISTIVPLTVVAVMWDQTSHTLLLVWLLGTLIMIAIRYAASSAYAKRTKAVLNPGVWARRMLYISLLLGALWCFAILAFFSEGSAPHQVFLITVAVTLGIGSISSGTHWLPLYYVYGVPILLSLIIRFALVGTLPYLALAAMMGLALMAAVAFAKKLNAVVRSEMWLRHESSELAGQLRIKTEEAEQAVYAKSRVLAAASHELRQPLHALSLFVDALRETLKNDEQVRILKRMGTSVGSLRKLFDSLFDMSRLDADVVYPEIGHFDLRPILQDLQDEYRDEATRRQLELRLRAPSCVIRTDRVLLERILRNLISNALRYTPAGGVLIAARVRSSSILIQVWDTGIGIPSESHDIAFIEFKRLQSASTDREKGLGFGLAIVRRLCDLMGYPVTLRSVLDRGSVFSLEVPRGDPEQVRQAHPEQPAERWRNPGHTVMIIDDDANILNAMKTLLSVWGFHPVVSQSPGEALDMAKAIRHGPDLILSDLSLPGQQNGIELIQKLRGEFQSKIPAFLISGSTNAVELKKAEDSGLKLIQKPISPMLLRSMIQHHLAATEPRDLV
ncbi:MAG: hybrid sensor histidine kinase/response regulator [Marinobacter sp.]|nr:hybrid sensor histidine kinase/response regulator [Marinobacter sp.]